MSKCPDCSADAPPAATAGPALPEETSNRNQTKLAGGWRLAAGGWRLAAGETK